MRPADSADTVLIAALGTGGYQPCYYHLNGSVANRTKLGFKGLSELLGIPFEQMVVFGTEAEPEKNLKGSDWEIVKEEFGRELKEHQKVVVDYGMNTGQHYNMFNPGLDYG